MAMRVRETPSGALRLSYAILATVVGGLGGLLVVAVVDPIFTSAGVCGTDQTLFCGLAMAILAWVVGTWLLMVWLTHALRMSWRFMVATVAGQLLVIEGVFQFDSLWLLVGLLVVPVIAALVSDPGHTLEVVPRWRSLTILVVGAAVLVEFLAWGWIGVLNG